MGLLDRKFKYTPSVGTNIVSTWKRHGFKPTTGAERLARQRRANENTAARPMASVTPLDVAKRKVLGWRPPERKTGGNQR